MDEKNTEGIGGEGTDPARPVNDLPPNVEKTAGHEGPTDQGDGGSAEPIDGNEHSSER